MQDNRLTAGYVPVARCYPAFYNVEGMIFMDNISKNNVGKIKDFLLFALNPAEIVRKKKQYNWFLYLIYPAVGWMIFFLQVGLDKFSGFRVFITMLLGLIIGYIAVGVIGFLIAFILARLGMDIRSDQVITLISMSHTYMLFSVLLGLVYRIFGSSSASAFGITGLLCTLLPIYAGIRILGKNKVYLPPLLATLTGVLLMFSWQMIIAIVS